MFWRLRRSSFSVYDWSAWQGMLVTNVVPGAQRIRAQFDALPAQIARRIPQQTRHLLVHLDITHNAPFISDGVELDRLLARRGIEVLNSRLRDISKRVVQSHCAAFGLPSLTARREGPDDEVLIVKTDLNSAGQRERLLDPAQRTRFRLPDKPGLITSPKRYLVKARAEIEPTIWNDSELVVERYLTNPEGRFYRVYVVKNAVVVSEAYSNILIKRMSNVRRLNHLLWLDGEGLSPRSASASGLHPGLLHHLGVFIARFAVDYAAVDVIESAAGEFYVVDVNKTPYWGEETQPGLLEHLRSGLDRELTQARKSW